MTRKAIPTPDSRRLGAAIRARREALHLSVEALAVYASRTGPHTLTKSWLSRLERGQIPGPSYQRLEQIARYFRCSVADLTGAAQGERGTIEAPRDRLFPIRQILANLPEQATQQLGKIAEGLGYLTADPEVVYHDPSPQSREQPFGQRLTGKPHREGEQQQGCDPSTVLAGND